VNKFNDFHPYGPHKARLVDPIRRDFPRKFTHKMRFSPERAMLTVYGGRNDLILWMLGVAFWPTASRRWAEQWWRRQVSDMRFRQGYDIAKRRVWQCKARHAKCQFSVKVGIIMEDSLNRSANSARVPFPRS
jgi:hypothetical protein